MLLAINVGNSNIKIGLFSDGSWRNYFRIRTVPENMPDDYAALFNELFRGCDVNPGDIAGAIISSVVPPLTETISNMVEGLIGKAPLIVAPGIRTGIRIHTDNPVEVGSELVANAVAAYELFETNCIVVDFGTAITFTAVAKPGDLLGVSIAPGIKCAAAVLSQEASQLPHVRLAQPPSAIGRNTIHSVQSGIIFGYLGLVEALVGKISGELGGEVKVVATGGLAWAFVHFSRALVGLVTLTLTGRYDSKTKHRRR